MSKQRKTAHLKPPERISREYVIGIFESHWIADGAPRRAAEAIIGMMIDLGLLTENDRGDVEVPGQPHALRAFPPDAGRAIVGALSGSGPPDTPQARLCEIAADWVRAASKQGCPAGTPWEGPGGWGGSEGRSSVRSDGGDARNGFLDFAAHQTIDTEFMLRGVLESAQESYEQIEEHIARLKWRRDDDIRFLGGSPAAELLLDLELEKAQERQRVAKVNLAEAESAITEFHRGWTREQFAARKHGLARELGLKLGTVENYERHLRSQGVPVDLAALKSEKARREEAQRRGRSKPKG